MKLTKDMLTEMVKEVIQEQMEKQKKVILARNLRVGDIVSTDELPGKYRVAEKFFQERGQYVNLSLGKLFPFDGGADSPFFMKFSADSKWILLSRGKK